MEDMMEMPMLPKATKISPENLRNKLGVRKLVLRQYIQGYRGALEICSYCKLVMRYTRLHESI